MPWQKLDDISARRFTCGFCGADVGSAKGYLDAVQNRHGVSVIQRIYVCPNCHRPTHFDNNERQTPGVIPGRPVDAVPGDLHALYDEARRCSSIGAFTSAVLSCRKMLMNIAVAQGAKAGETFISYVEYLAGNGYVPPNGKGWVDHIRKKGNEATHEILVMTKADAEELISFVEMLLKFIYEFPARVPSAP